MTTKINRIPFPAPHKSVMSATGGMRIIIDIDPVQGGTSMRVEGPVSPILIMDTLVQQFHSYWNTVWKQMDKGIVTPNGLPTAITKPRNAQECDGFEATDNNPELCRHCGSHYGNHPKEKGGTDADNGAST